MIWKDVLGYEGFYKVSENGDVKRIVSFRNNGGSGYLQPEKMLKKTPRGKTGYLCVHLSKEGKSKVINIHRLVANAFLKPDVSRTQVNHIDGDKTNNNYKNLEWNTPKENINHCDKYLGRKRNLEGLKLGAKATIKKNLNITNGIKIFNTFEEIKIYLENEIDKSISKKQIYAGISRCCKDNNKTFYGFKWEHVK